MNGGWWYRIAGVGGTLALAVAAVFVANQPLIQGFVEFLPVISSLAMDTATGSELVFEAATTAMVIIAVMIPLFKPRPRRILDIWMEGLRRTSIGILALATIGYFDYTYRLPRATLIVTGGLLLVTLPAFFVTIRRRPRGTGDRILIVGDNPQSMADILDAVDGNVIGYVSPPSPYDPRGGAVEGVPHFTDGGTANGIDNLANLGGLSRLDEILIQFDVSTAVLAFDRTDRAEFFGALDTCYEQGVRALVHREHADTVLTSGKAAGHLVEIDLEPWDWQDYVFKRLFDVCFAGAGLLVLSPAILLISIAIKVDSEGPLLYSQERTAEFGDTFRIYKFRSMVENAESQTGVKLSEEDIGEPDPRVTRVGSFLRQTHLDEIPQLWSILVGDMSVVGPRPERPELDSDIESGVSDWRRRWFVKPGLTGLAQINGVTGYDPDKKLRFDIQYIRQQSFWYDLKIVIRQVWMVLWDLLDPVR